MKKKQKVLCPVCDGPLTRELGYVDKEEDSREELCDIFENCKSCGYLYHKDLYSTDETIGLVDLERDLAPCRDDRDFDARTADIKLENDLRLAVLREARALFQDKEFSALRQELVGSKSKKKKKKLWLDIGFWLLAHSDKFPHHHKAFVKIDNDPKYKLSTKGGKV